jgi:serine/threonine protein kinase
MYAVAGIGHGKLSDVWSLGATLHVLLTGPFGCPFGRRPALSPADVRENVLEGRRCVDIGAALKAREYEVFVPLVNSCLQPQPDLRPTASEALQMLLHDDLNLTSMGP